MTAVTVLAAALSQHAHAYVLADPAQDKSLPNALLFESANAVCLLDGGADVRAVAPHLIRIDAANYLHAGAWLDQYAANVPCATLLISTMPLAAMAAHLSAFVDVVLPDRTVMALAFWDPSILAVLSGARGDGTQHVRGSVLTAEQKQAFLAPVLEWWYWDRAGHLQSIDWDANSIGDASALIQPPMQFDQNQVDELVEASVPDGILYYIRLNMPGLLLRIPDSAQYAFVRSQILNARQYGLEGTGDLVNYCCVALAYGDAFNTLPEVAVLLEQVKTKVLTFDDLMKNFPPNIPTVEVTHS
ncbi:DUF4123 domain-containing protein [Paraburkholderia terricola]|uniref:DUF4123 domain-containing protein n=1 Tax=Paraburkholderia terricola TaxID=169427 RepID=A0ABU1M0I5_9BURK|nr:DUF4123 domain-containing protein [Paraburkholderia terricola]MDR6412510.1 hypothetical protein [Paraburkholderia terricola]MDR6485484.1 hypothetical protein [Paraburkholderia terricola]